MIPTRFKNPARSALAATLAAALALSPITAAPAQAGTEDKAGAIAAASFIALLTAGIIASNAQQNRAQPPQFTFTPSRRHDDRHDNRARTDRRKVLPQQCEFTVRHGKDRGTYYDSRCLRSTFNGWPYLPDRCEERIAVRGGRDTYGYDAQCLARFGYSDGKPPRSARR